MDQMMVSLYFLSWTHAGYKGLQTPPYIRHPELDRPEDKICRFGLEVACPTRSLHLVLAIAPNSRAIEARPRWKTYSYPRCISHWKLIQSNTSRMISFNEMSCTKSAVHLHLHFPSPSRAPTGADTFPLHRDLFLPIYWCQRHAMTVLMRVLAHSILMRSIVSRDETHHIIRSIWTCSNKKMVNSRWLAWPYFAIYECNCKSS